MNVSANTVFHFTRTYDNLLGILREEFKPRYNYEDLKDVIPNVPLFQTYIPMTCFCDIPLSAIEKHADEYGPYAIGLTKEWAERKGLNPILYLRKGSQAAEYVKDLIVGFRNHTELAADLPFVQSFYEFNTIIKAYEEHPQGKPSGKVFYDEREWRYVPRILNHEFYSRLTWEDYNNKEKRSASERQLDAHHRLGFRPSDIRYLIVTSEEQILRLAREIPRIKHKYNRNEQVLLITKIKSLESLQEDL